MCRSQQSNAEEVIVLTWKGVSTKHGFYTASHGNAKSLGGASTVMVVSSTEVINRSLKPPTAHANPNANCSKKRNKYENRRFVNGLQNARGLLDSLERSFEKSCKYEDKLLRCRSEHGHAHGSKDWCSTDGSLTRGSGSCSNQDKSKISSQTRSYTNVTESWSTMSIACLQYQYEELSKRYQMLLRAYDERCKSLSSQDGALLKLYQRLKKTNAELINVNKSLLIIGEKYLHLRYKRLTQKIWYEERIDRLKRASRAVLVTAERARSELDEQLDHILTREQDTAITLLLQKIRKCNLLFLENLRLKSRIEEMM